MMSRFKFSFAGLQTLLCTNLQEKNLYLPKSAVYLLVINLCILQVLLLFALSYREENQDLNNSCSLDFKI